jgi:hypothetical protein
MMVILKGTYHSLAQFSQLGSIFKMLELVAEEYE